MKIFMFISLFAIALAEPPVGDGYPAARSSHDHEHHHDYNLESVRSLSQEYGVPVVEARSQKHDSVSSKTSASSYFPSSRSTISQEYGQPGLRSGPSQEYGPPSLRNSPSQEYGVPNSRLSQQYGPPNFRNTPSAEYGVPSQSSDFNAASTRLSQEYGVPQLRMGSEEYNTIGDFPLDSYSTPLQKSPSIQYGPPQLRSNPSEARASSQNVFGPSQRSSSTSQKYFPGQRSVQNVSPISRDSSARSKQNKPYSSVTSRNFKSSFGSGSSGSLNFGTSRSLSTQFDAPNTRNSDTYIPNVKSGSQSYLPSSRTVSQTYGVPNERSLSTEYGPPDGRINLKNNAFSSSYDTIRLSPSAKYGVPSARDSMPSDQYGVPDQYSLSNQGYSYARNALDELLNQEPANYDFGYKVNDFVSGSDFGHTETRQDNKAEGSYFVVLPDGTKQVVEYEADERGFKPRISVEPAEVRSGYDENASDLSRSGDGPY